MPSNPDLRAAASSLENESPSHTQALRYLPRISRQQKLTAISFACIASGYAAFADTMECVYTMLPLRFEYQFDQKLSENKWLIISITTAGIYGLSTFLSEGKGVYDSLSGYFINRNRNRAAREGGELPEVELEESQSSHPDQLPQRRLVANQNKRPGKITSGLIWLTPRFVSLIGSAADSSETTMGLVKEGASASKTIAISSLSFLGSFCFYAPVTVAAMNELFLGKTTPQALETRSSHFLAKLAGYPVAVFSAIQDTLECGASLFQNFGVTSLAGQWSIVCASSLAGISGLGLDGKKGVEIIDNFLANLEKNYAWLPRAQRPSREQLFLILYESSTTGLAAFAASYIAFADKELTISLTEEILATLGTELPLLPQILGWCVVLRDFVIQTNTLNTLEHFIIMAGYQGWKKLRQLCCGAKEPAALVPPPEREALDLDQLLPEDKDEPLELPILEDDDSDNEQTELLLSKPPPESSPAETRPWFHYFFKPSAREPRQDNLDRAQERSYEP